MMSERDIDATNVLPAFEASLRFGATEDIIEAHVGWRRDQLSVAGATVSGTSTYMHMELMAGKSHYEQFVLDAVQRHGASSLGAVGLACRSCSSFAEAFAYHGRFQRLTNRTAEYSVSIEDTHIVVTEERFGEPRRGSLLISDYGMLVAVHLLSSIAVDRPQVKWMRSRRATMPADEQAAYEGYLGAPIELGSKQAQLALDLSLLQSPVVTADTELAAYFDGVLHEALGSTADEPPLLQDVRRLIRDELLNGAPTAAEIARALGLGQRTLQRRLSELGHTFGDVLEDTRRTLADILLADPRMSLAEVAYLLGYTEQSSFYRAFRRWHDTTPAAYRKARQTRSEGI